MATNRLNYVCAALYMIRYYWKKDSFFFLSPREVYVDPDTGVPYDILMSKVDVKYGMFGLNNFYKMQVRLVLHNLF